MQFLNMKDKNMPNNERSEKYIPLFPLSGKGGKMDFKEQYFDLWVKAWNFHKKYSNISGTDEYWEQVVNESSEIVKEFENKPEYNFMKDLVLAVISEIERVDKHKRKESKKVG